MTVVRNAVIEGLDHRPVFGPADGPVLRDLHRDADAGFDQVGQADHAPEAVGIRVHVGNDYHAVIVFQTGEKTIRAARDR